MCVFSYLILRKGPLALKANKLFGKRFKNKKAKDKEILILIVKGVILSVKKSF